MDAQGELLARLRTGFFLVSAWVGVIAHLVQAFSESRGRQIDPTSEHCFPFWGGHSFNVKTTMADCQKPMHF